jgi:serine protease
MGDHRGNNGGEQSDENSDRVPTPPREGSAGDPRDGEIIIGFSDDVSDLEAEARAAAPSGSNVLRVNERLNAVLVELPDSAAMADTMAGLDSQDGVDFAEENVIVSADDVDPGAAVEAAQERALEPNDPSFADQFAPQQVNAREAWETTLGSSEVTIAVLDQGVKYDHEDLAPNMDDSVQNFGVDFAGTSTGVGEYPGEDTDPYPKKFKAGEPWYENDTEAHGTQVAGISAARADNGTGVSGISNCSILSVRVLGTSGFGSGFDIADGISWAVDFGADVVNLSLGSPGEADIYDRAVEYADENGVLTVASAGNGSTERDEYGPGSQVHLGVSAVESGDDSTLAGFSNTGDYVDLTAPGTSYFNTETAYPADLETGDPSTDTYTGFSGTSMAAPVVSGVAGLALSADPDLTLDELVRVLETGARDVGLTEKEQGAGHVDAANAVDPPLTLEVAGDSTTRGGTAEIGVETTGAGTVTVEDIWTDWEVDSTDTDAPTVTNDVVEAGQVEFSWDDKQLATSPVLALDVPSRYAGGRYVLTVTVKNDETTVTDTVTVEITSE